MKEKAFAWIESIIKTCNNNFHFEAVDKLIELFKERFDDNRMILELEQMRHDKWNEIHKILY